MVSLPSFEHFMASFCGELFLIIDFASPVINPKKIKKERKEERDGFKVN